MPADAQPLTFPLSQGRTNCNAAGIGMDAKGDSQERESQHVRITQLSLQRLESFLLLISPLENIRSPFTRQISEGRGWLSPSLI